MKKLLTISLIAILALSLAGCVPFLNGAPNPTQKASTANEKFPDFVGKDFDGNDLDQSIFSEHDLTVVNFWFNSCPVCIAEIPGLEDLNKQLSEKNAAVVGINVEAPAGEAFLEKAKTLLSEHSATYKNIYITGGDEAISFISFIPGYPASFLVNKDGNIIEGPIFGRIDDEQTVNSILKKADEL